MNTLNYKKSLVALGVAALLSTSASAGEVPIGEVEKNGMVLAAVYLQPVTMFPSIPGFENASIHLEADIHALEGNKNGFGAGEWMPYLDITYHITKKGSDWSTTGRLLPMVASDGPHYADNITLDDAGEYHLVYNIAPPAYSGFIRHTDKETGVGKWWDPFVLEWSFGFTGVGKKGDY
ncbi:MAG: iron transporter [Arenicellales bacterium]|mgnify:FL=1|jgi:hypothetical protein|nr:iron transporter [Arenicellales bacterium]MDP7522026.1 iron transporter [Arenicellales bacterium]